jgi:hypothetical protein
MAERDTISEFAAAQQKYASEAEGHFRELDDDLKSTWRSVTGTMHQMNIEANGAVSRIEKMREDPTVLGPDPHKALHLTAEQAATNVENHRATTRTRLDVFTNLLKAAARPSVPADIQKQALLRDDLRTKLSGLPPDQQVQAFRAVASGQNRELAGLLHSDWGKDFRRSLGHGSKEIDDVVSEETIRGSATHGVGREKAAAFALSAGIPAAEKALLAAHLGAKSKIDKVRPGQPVVGNWSGGY